MSTDDVNEPIRTIFGVIDTEHYATEARLAQSLFLWALVRGAMPSAAPRRATFPVPDSGDLTHLKPTT